MWTYDHTHDVAQVAASEYDTLTVARALVGQLSAEAVRPLLRSTRDLPKGLGPTAIELLKRTFSRGLVLELGRRGGWRRTDHLKVAEDGSTGIASGRLWERHEAMPLELTPLSLAICRWMVASPMHGELKLKLPRRQNKASAGDHFVLYLACDLLARSGCKASLASVQVFRASPLCWLGFADLLAAERTPDIPADKAFDALFEAPAVVLLEALQQDLARRWQLIEQSKSTIVQPKQMIALGKAQTTLLDRICSAAERHGRQDLATFILAATSAVLAQRANATAWVRSLSREGTLRDRSRACQSASALLGGLQRMHTWAVEAQNVRFFDDDYDSSQLVLRCWEQLGPNKLARAQQLAQELCSIDVTQRDDENEQAQ